MTLSENAAQNSIVITDESGSTVTFTLVGSTWTAPTYNASTLTNSAGTWTYTRWDGYAYNFNSSGKITSESDRNGNTTSFAYTSGVLTSVTDASGRTLTVCWNGATCSTGTNIKSIEDPDGQYVYFFYDSSGNLHQVEDQNGNSTYYTYDSNHEMLTEEDKDANTTTYTYTNFKITKAVDQLSREIDYSYASPATNINTTLKTVDPGSSPHLNLETQYTTTYGLLTQVIAGYGSSPTSTTTYTYDPATLGLSEEASPLLTGTWLMHDTNGNVLGTKAIPATGSTTTTSATYSSLNEPLTRTDPNGDVTSDYYDTLGNRCWETVDSVANTSTGCTTYPTLTSSYATIAKYSICESSTCTVGSNTYSKGDVESTIDPDGNTTTLSYNSYGNVASTSNAASDVTCMWYDSLSRETTLTPPLGNTSGCSSSSNYTITFTYNPLNEVLTKSAPSPTGSGTATTTNTYDSNGNLLTTVDPVGNHTTNTYDGDNEKCWTDLSSSALSSPTCGTIPTGATSQAYDADGRVTSATDADGNTSTFAYNALSQKMSASDALSDKTTYTYDASSDVLTVVSPNGNVSGCGCASSYTTTNTYDGYGHLLTTQDPNSHTTTFTYDANGNRLTASDPVGNITTATYEINNRLCWTANSTSAISSPTCGTRPSGTGITVTAQNKYDANGNVLTVEDGNGNFTTNAYNAAGEECWTYNGSVSGSYTCSSNVPTAATQYTYDHDRNLLTTTQPSAAVITNSYNYANLRCVTYDGSTSQPCGSTASSTLTTYSYDADGNMTGMGDGTGSSSWVYNYRSQLTSYTNGAASQVQYSRDANGNPTQITYPSGTKLTQTFNGANQTCWAYVGTSSNSCSSAPTGSIGYTYDHNGNLTQETLPTTTATNNTFNYDGTNSISSISGVFTSTYTRNSDNLITKDTSQPSSTQYDRYTSLNQVCAMSSSAPSSCPTSPGTSNQYLYDSAGNSTGDNGKTEAFNSTSGKTDQLCWSVSGNSSNGCGSAPSGATTYTYNTNGDRTGAGSTSSYQYNDFNQLCWYYSGSSTAACGSAPTGSTTYKYDGTGLRMSKTTGSSTTSFAWADTGANPGLLQETTGTNTTTYVYDPRGYPVAEILPSGSTYYYAQDAIGSVRKVEDSSGTVQNSYTYDPYGNVTSSSGSVQNNLKYSGQYLDSESGLYYLRARYYDSITAQFMTVDPLLAATGQPYAYTAGNPLNGSDPTGLRYTTGCEDGGSCPSSGPAPVMPCDMNGTCSSYGPSGPGDYGSGGSYDPTQTIQQAIADAQPVNAALEQQIQAAIAQQQAQQQAEIYQQEMQAAAQASTQQMMQSFDAKGPAPWVPFAIVGGAVACILACVPALTSGAAFVGINTVENNAPAIESDAGGVAAADSSPIVGAAGDGPASQGLQNQIYDHLVKLNNYMQNPLDYDNNGILSNAINNGVGDANAIYLGRIEHLLKEIRAFNGG